MPTYQWKHRETGEVREVTCRIAMRDMPPEGWKETECDRIVAAPLVLQASYPDGLRAKSESWRDMREAAKLRVDQANMFDGDPQRKHIGEEIRKLEASK